MELGMSRESIAKLSEITKSCCSPVIDELEELSRENSIYLLLDDTKRMLFD